MDDFLEPTTLLDPAAFLCHYTSADTAPGAILQTRTLRMNTYGRMRDPLEKQHPHLWVPAGRANEEARHRSWVRISNHVGAVRAEARLLSFTEGDLRSPTTDVTDRDAPFRAPWGRPRMWEQYADNHAGVCLVFDRNPLLCALREALIQDFWEGSVAYTVSGVSGTDAVGIDLDAFDDETSVRRYLVENSRDFFFTKTEDWATEFEYRVVSYAEPASSDLDLPPRLYLPFADSLRAVLVGENFPTWQHSAARRIAERNEAHFLLMTWSGGRPYPGTLLN